MGSSGWVRSSAWTCNFSSTHEDNRLFGWIHVQTDDVPHLLNEERLGGEPEAVSSVRLQSKARQIRLIDDWLSPQSAAIERVIQCVVLAGSDSSVFVITRSTSSSRMVCGTPVRGPYNSPSSQRATNRRRHFPTVFPQSSKRSATWRFISPSRTTGACVRAGQGSRRRMRREKRFKTSRSSSGRVNAAGSS